LEGNKTAAKEGRKEEKKKRGEGTSVTRRENAARKKDIPWTLSAKKRKRSRFQEKKGKQRTSRRVKGLSTAKIMFGEPKGGGKCVSKKRIYAKWGVQKEIRRGRESPIPIMIVR